MCKFFQLTCWILFLLIASCAPSRFVKPLEKNKSAISVSAGGPLIKYNKSTVPIPFATAIYGYGVGNKTTAFAGLNATSALYGNFQTEAGATLRLSSQHKFMPAFSVTPVINFIYRNSKTTRVYPQVDLNAFWEYGKNKNLIYVGVDNWFELRRQKAHGRSQRQAWFFSPMIGHTLVKNKWEINIEIKVMAPHVSNQNIVVEYQTPFKNHGAFGVYLSYNRKF